MAHEWTEETEAELRRLWAEGVTVTDIQRRLRIGQETMDAARKRLNLPTRAAPSWNAEEDAQLKALWISGKSASEIARIMKGRSRNSIIGRVHRMGMSNAGRAACASPAPDVRKRTYKAPKVARSNVRPPKPGPQNKPALVMGAYKHEPNFAKAEIIRAKKTEAGIKTVARVTSGAGVESPNAVPLLDYVRGCKWPLGERGAVHYCCNPQVEGRSYCEGHLALSMNPVQPDRIRTRDASRLTRFDRVERDTPRPARAERTLWDDARLEAA